MQGIYFQLDDDWYRDKNELNDLREKLRHNMKNMIQAATENDATCE